MAALPFIRVSAGLSPASEEAWAAVRKIKEGQSVRVEIARIRSPEQLRLYWSLIGAAHDNQDYYATKEDLSDAVKCRLGYCYEIRDGDKMIQRPKSIALGNMDQDSFNQFFDAAAKLLAETIGVTPESMRAEATEIEALRAEVYSLTSCRLCGVTGAELETWSEPCNRATLIRCLWNERTLNKPPTKEER